MIQLNGEPPSLAYVTIIILCIVVIVYTLGVEWPERKRGKRK